LAAVIGALVDRILVTRSGSEAAGFEVRDVKWSKEEGNTYISYKGTARIVGTGGGASGRYMVLVGFIRSQRVNPATQPDTTWETVITSQGVSSVSGDETAYGCNWSREIKPPNCTPHFRDLIARWVVAGWVKLAEPAADSERAAR